MAARPSDQTGVQMKYIKGIAIGGLQQKIFNLMVIFIAALIAAYAAVAVFQQRNLSGIVEDAAGQQQAAITAVSEQTMDAVLQTSMSRTTALQAYIADDLFSDVRTDVLTLQAFAEEIFAHAERYPAHAFYAPDAENDGKASVMMQYEEGVDPNRSRDLGLAANMSEVMLAMYQSSDKLNSCFVATTDGCILFVDNRAGAYFTESGEPELHFDVRHRPWYTQAVEAGELIFTGVEPDSFTDILGLVCAAPVYRNGELVAVVGADIFLTSISDYVRTASSENGFLCVIDDEGRVLFSAKNEGVFKAELSADAQDLRQNENKALADFVTRALTERTPLTLVSVDGKDYYMVGAPMGTLGWTVVSVVEKEITQQPTAVMLAQYAQINENSLATFREGAGHSLNMILLLTALIVALAIIAALVVAGRIVKPLRMMTERINALSGSDQAFEMEDKYRTGDEIEILAESFATLSKRTRTYIEEITEITAEKERIGTELSLATQIQAAMLPHIVPAFPDRTDFDIFGSMDPAKEVGGDFYDYFLVDPDHLCMVIADVSGKGVPAALFMMASKIIIQSVAMMGKSPAEILTKTNEAICSNNEAQMFVTVWVGILELSTGRLTASNAGHEYPVFRHPDGSFELYKDRHGFVIGGMEGARYREYTVQLEPGAKLFVYTDGVPEATNAQNELFGTDRMLDALNRQPDATPMGVLQNVRAAVDDFVLDAEQFDDLTMLCLAYKGKEPDHEGTDA